MTQLIDKTKTVDSKRMAITIFIAALLAFIVSSVLPEPAPARVPTVDIKIVEKPVEEIAPVAALTLHDKRQIQCLAENAYFEAGNQSIKGKIAVTNVVMNRVEDKRYPKTPCGVVHQRTSRVCQFSWVCEGKKRIRSMVQYADARKVAEDVYLGKTGDVTRGAKFYHADYVNPGWNLRRITKIGDHIFYRG